MPQADAPGAARLPHVVIDATRSREAYQPRGFPRTPKQLRNDYPGHAARLKGELSRALGEAIAGMAAVRVLPGAEEGAYLEFETMPDKALPDLERRSDGIRLANLKVVENGAQVGTIYVPSRAAEGFSARIDAYGTANPGNRERPHLDEFAVVEAIRARGLSSLWNGRTPPPADGERWWELWCFSDRGAAMRDVLVRLGLDRHPDALSFPDAEILFVHGTLADLERVVANASGAVMEIRLAGDTPSAVLEARDLGAQEPWLTDLLARLEAPPPGAPIVCLHDTGVARAHPLLAAGVAFADTLDNNWGTADHKDGGHGTQMCGLALHGDLFAALQDRRVLGTTHAVGSVKLLPPPTVKATDPNSFGLRTRSAVFTAEANGGERVRAHCIASSTDLHDASRPSSWSAAIDRAASGFQEADDGQNGWQAPKRLFIIAAGNVPSGLTREVASRLHPIEDPAQSWNALTIGGYTARDRIDPPEEGAELLAKANERSPYSRVSCDLNWDSVPIKPDVVFEAGNVVARGDDCDHGHDSVSLIAPGKRFGIGMPLTKFWATSAAAGLAGHFVGRLAAATPDLWPETHRALVVHSADWTTPMRKRLRKSYAKSRKIAAVREFGFGVPDFERAVGSARNDVALIAQATIQPFAWPAGASAAIFNDIHYYDLPWPRAALEALENAEVALKVTLSYFVEPNPGGRAATRDDTYRSFGLRFRLRRRDETEAQFRGRINKLETLAGAPAPDQDTNWLLGPNSIRAGSLHCDVWRGPAVDLAARSQIAIHPVGGWWKRSRERANDVGRYSLVLSLDARGHDVDLHAEVAALVASSVEVPV